MKSLMQYGGNKYGNTSNAAKYSVKLTRIVGKNVISIEFKFDSPAVGRGIGDAKGSVQKVAIEIPAKTAEALSHALQLALSDTASSGAEFQIAE